MTENLNELRAKAMAFDDLQNELGRYRSQFVRGTSKHIDGFLDGVGAAIGHSDGSLQHYRQRLNVNPAPSNIECQQCGRWFEQEAAVADHACNPDTAEHQGLVDDIEFCANPDMVTIKRGSVPPWFSEVKLSGQAWEAIESELAPADDKGFYNPTLYRADG